MEQVPNIISTKDLSYLCDIFNWNYNACKDVHHYFEITNNNLRILVVFIRFIPIYVICK